MRQSKEWDLILYIAGKSTRTMDSVATAKAMCHGRLKGRCHLEIVDLMEHPDRAIKDQIVATPTLVRKHPNPEKKLIGISTLEKIFSGLEVEKLSIAR